MNKVYEQFDSAFCRVAADVILFDGPNVTREGSAASAPVGRIAWKYPADGAGRLYCYLQIWGGPMVRAFAGGYGYDKRGAAFRAAVRKLAEINPENESYSETQAAALKVIQSLESDQWNAVLNDLRKQGVLIQHVID